MTLPGPLVSSSWLAEHIDRVQVVDVRWSIDRGPHREDYLAAHLPGAVFADLDVDLSDPPGERGRHPLPTPERFAAARTTLGMVERPVVAYDDRSGATASRLWWLLDAIGHPVAVLDGGIAGWEGETEAGDGPSPALHPVEAIAWPPDRFIEADGVLAAIGDGAVLIDARTAARFEGQPNPIDASPGHIPGGRSRPWTDNVDEAGRYLPADRLTAELAGIGVSSGVDLISSCGSGVTACQNLLAARLAGIEGGRLYTGSWSEWSADPDRPVATGPAEGSA